MLEIRYCDIRTELAMEPIEYEVRQPFRYLPAVIINCCRRHPWNVLDAFWVTLRAVMENAFVGLESPAVPHVGGERDRADRN